VVAVAMGGAAARQPACLLALLPALGQELWKTT